MVLKWKRQVVGSYGGCNMKVITANQNGGSKMYIKRVGNVYI
jgi:hypothetical protein